VLKIEPRIKLENSKLPRKVYTCALCNNGQLKRRKAEIYRKEFMYYFYLKDDECMVIRNKNTND